MREWTSQAPGKRFRFMAALALLAVGLQIAWVAVLWSHERWEADAPHATNALTAPGSAEDSAPSGSSHHDHSTCHVCQMLAQVRIGAIVAVVLQLLMLGIVPAFSVTARILTPYVAPILSGASSPRAPPIA